MAGCVVGEAIAGIFVSGGKIIPFGIVAKALFAAIGIDPLHQPPGGIVTVISL
jgi:hypothetical protein